ncbi:MAG: hypothetical protein LBC80_10245 [Treponema sp.]|nr:hypothetical protein [Treponema sp.]
MKKIAIMFLALAMATSFVMAEEGGFSAGLELVFPDVTGDGDFALTAIPFVGYEGALMDGALDLNAKLNLELGVLSDEFGDDMPIRLLLELGTAYNVSEELAILLDLDFGLHIAPDIGDDTMLLQFTPGIKYSMAMDFGDVFAQVKLPLALSGMKMFGEWGPGSFEQDLEAFCLITLGWANNGIGFELTPMLHLTGDDVYCGLILLGSYESGPLYAELEIALPDDFDYGITLTPFVEYSVSEELKVWFGLEIGNIAAEYGDVAITPFLGVKYSF